MKKFWYALLFLLIASPRPGLAATQNYPVTAVCGQAQTGQAANLNVVVKDAAGTTRITTATWTEETDAAGASASGSYDASLAIDPSWAYPLSFKVTITGQAGFTASGFILAPLALDASGFVKTNVQTGSVTVAGYATGQDPGSYLLITPANKLSTDTSGRMKLAAGEKTDVAKTLLAYVLDPATSTANPSPLTLQQAILMTFENVAAPAIVSGATNTYLRNDWATTAFAVTLPRTGGVVSGKTISPGTLPAAPTPLNP